MTDPRKSVFLHDLHDLRPQRKRHWRWRGRAELFPMRNAELDSSPRFHQAASQSLLDKIRIVRHLGQSIVQPQETTGPNKRGFLLFHMQYREFETRDRPG